MARVATTTREAQPFDSLQAQVKEYKYLKDQIDSLSKRQKEIRDDLMVAVENAGYEDDKGHYWLEFDDEIDGVGALQRMRRVSNPLDEEAAQEILTSLGLWEECTEEVRVVDQDAVMAALWNEKLTPADIDCIYPPKVTWALVLK